MSSGLIWIIKLPLTAVSVVIDLLEIVPAANRPVEVTAVYLGQTTDLGEAQEEQLQLEWITSYTTSGSGGATGTQESKKVNAPTVGFSTEVFNTTLATGGTPRTVGLDSWQVRVPYAWREILDEESPEVSAAITRMVLRIPVAPVDEISIWGSIEVREKT